jgi:hypothetical protein
MKTQSNIPIPQVQLWKANQYMVAINQQYEGLKDMGMGISQPVYTADFTIVDALTAEAALYAFTRQQNDVVLDNKVINNIEVDGKPAIESKPVYASKAQPTIFPSFPATGTSLKKGEVYSYGNGAIMVVQDHARTIYAPELTPALFSFYRIVTEGQEWIAGEQVTLNATRTFNSKTYKCIQSHQTQATWNPELTLNVLWQIVVVVSPETKPPQWVTGNWGQYVLGYQVFDRGKVWEVKGITHTWIQPAMNGNGAISWKFIKDWI